jgi:carboxyl-terminal processing protease
VNTRHLIIPSLIALITLSSGTSAVEDGGSYARLARSIEAFGSVFREVTSTYVDTLAPEDLVEVGIDAMLKSLDPYSTYMRGDESEDIDVLTGGSYVGFGFTVGVRDSLLTILEVRADGPAYAAGVRVGDHLVAVDDDRTDTLAPSELRPFSRGLPGSTATLRFTRPGMRDTIVRSIPRASLPLELVGHSQLLPGGIAYVRLVRFGRGSGNAVRDAITSMAQNQKLKGVVLDLRDNPGGLLDAAVDVAEVFVPRGSVIVTTRGRGTRETREYVSQDDPLVPAYPLAVLINERSASASEIVAGAIQDLDRGVILGTQSFGKGLVQTVVPLPNEASLKLTTSRYFTPSGRSIQKVNYGKRASTASTERYLTRNGRPVDGRHGITPDSIITDSVLPSALAYLDAEYAFGRFASRYTARMDSLPASFAVTPAVVDTFVKTVASLPPAKRSPVLAQLADVRRKAVSAGWSGAALQGLDYAERSIERELEKTIRQHQRAVTAQLDREIRARFGAPKAREERALAADPVVRVARELLGSSSYHAILGSQVPSDH